MRHTLSAGLSLPVIGAPMFIVSGPELVIAQCRAGIIGSFPALNARQEAEFEPWIVRIKAALAVSAGEARAVAPAPFAVNLCANRSSNRRLEHDLDVCARQQVPIVITNMSSPREIAQTVHGYGGIVLHDVINSGHAEKALHAGADGLILVCGGAGGHGGTLNPFAFIQEVRSFHHGLLILSGGISNGRGVFAAQAMGVDLAYIGTRFIATEEADAVPAYKQMIVDSRADDIVYTSYFSGIKANYLKSSISIAGLDPDNLPASDHEGRYVAGPDKPKAWKDIWGAGQGVGAIHDVPPVALLVARMRKEYLAARDEQLAASGRHTAGQRNGLVILNGSTK
ncbi:NAD(P)H-dependent flavin oxidoreductase [Paraburkholderia aromaticivorans]|uniref:NAD(P)H-dependent flavin oxidoreductase n=1 Tax=Paraburkholderia aromaticivorans TaxID=2026199 RepID=UPI001455E0EB|nr:nitronate monooxygenase family protein [Paraburkholderia aromaticivorans]